MPRDFEARRQRAIGVLRKEISLGSGLMREHEKACLAVLEAEPVLIDRGVESTNYSSHIAQHDEWQRLCTLILDGVGVK